MQGRSHKKGGERNRSPNKKRNVVAAIPPYLIVYFAYSL